MPQLISQFNYPTKGILQCAYPNFSTNFNNVDFLQSRGIFVSTIEQLDEINDYVVSSMSDN